MFDTSRRDRPDPPADSPDVDNPPPVSIEVFGRDPLIDATPAEPTLEAPRDEAPPAEPVAEEEEPVDTPAAATPGPDAGLRGLRGLRDELIQLVEGRLGGLETQVEQLGRQAAFLPPKLRGLGDKLGDLAAPLSDARSRALMVDLLMVDDLVRSGLADEQDADAARRTLTAVSQLLASVLDSHGVSEIGTDGAFDPTVHQAVQQLPVDEPDHDGQVLEVYRRGLRTEQRVLRYAEVGVARYVPHEDDPADEAEDAPTDPNACAAEPEPADDPGPASDSDDDTTP